MAIILFDGFDYYNDTGTYSSKWKGTYFNSCGFTSTGGRGGGGAMTFGGNNSLSAIYRWGGTPSTIIMGFAIKFSSITSSSAYFAGAFDASSSYRAAIGLNSSGDLIFSDGSGTSLGTYAAGFSTGNWYHIQWKYTPALSCAANSNIVKINNTTVINVAAGTKTTSGTTYNVQGIQIGTFAGALNTYSNIIDDFYLLDNTGSAANDFIGDCYVGVQKPNANGYYNQFTPTGVANNYQAAQSYDGDTSYCKTNDLYRQSFTLGALSDVMDTVFGINNISIARKEGAGSHTIKNLLRIAGTDYEGAANSLGTSYAQNIDLITLNPATGLAWTQSDINAMESGIRVSA